MEFPKDHSEQATLDLLESLDKGKTIVFKGANIDLYEDFIPGMTFKEEHPEVSFSSYDWHNPPKREPLLVESYSSIEAVPQGTSTPTISLNEERQIMYASFIAHQGELYPFAQDVDHLIPERLAQEEILARELQEYAASYIAERGPVDLNATFMCRSCLGTGMTNLLQNGVPLVNCIDCFNGFRLTHPTILIGNTETGDSHEFAVDPAAWIANGELTVRWRPASEYGIKREGFILDGEAFMKNKLQSISIDPDNAFAVSRNALLGEPYLDTYNVPIDEFSIFADELPIIEKTYGDIANWHHAGEAFNVMFQPFRPSSVAFAELRKKADARGRNIGYTKKSSRYSEWKPVHTFLLVNQKGTKFREILPVEYRSGVISLNQAIEETILALEHPETFKQDRN